MLSQHTWYQAAWTSEVIKMHGPPGTVCSPSTWCCLGLGKTQNAHPNESVPLWSTQEPEKLRPGKCTKRQACFGQYPRRGPWSLSSVDPGNTCHLELWQIQCGPYTVNTPHTCQQYLFAVSPPPHNRTEQVSLNKRPPSPLYVRIEIRHWGDLQTEEAKIKKTEPLRKWQVQQIKTL